MGWNSPCDCIDWHLEHFSFFASRCMYFWWDVCRISLSMPCLLIHLFRCVKMCLVIKVIEAHELDITFNCMHFPSYQWLAMPRDTGVAREGIMRINPCLSVRKRNLDNNLEKGKIKIASVRACRLRRFALNTAQKRLSVGLCPEPLGKLTSLPQSSGLN